MARSQKGTKEASYENFEDTFTYPIFDVDFIFDVLFAIWESFCDQI